MFTERRLINIVFHGNSSLTLQEVAPLAPIYDDKEDVDFYFRQI